VTGGTKVSQILRPIIAIIAIDMVNLKRDTLLLSKAGDGFLAAPNTVIRQDAHSNQGPAMTTKIVERGLLHQDELQQPLLPVGDSSNWWCRCRFPGGMRELEVTCVQLKVCYPTSYPLRRFSSSGVQAKGLHDSPKTV
jgi:hypothetical protein